MGVVIPIPGADDDGFFGQLLMVLGHLFLVIGH